VQRFVFEVRSPVSPAALCDVGQLGVDACSARGPPSQHVGRAQRVDLTQLIPRQRAVRQQREKVVSVAGIDPRQRVGCRGGVGSRDVRCGKGGSSFQSSMGIKATFLRGISPRTCGHPHAIELAEHHRPRSLEGPKRRRYYLDPIATTQNAQAGARPAGEKRQAWRVVLHGFLVEFDATQPPRSHEVYAL
jgi:hypothetical protein